LNRDQFEAWMVQNARMAPQTAYNYSVAINRISTNYSMVTGNSTDIYSIRDIRVLSGIADQYDIGGQYSQFGQIGNGTNRAAIKKLKRYLEAILANGQSESETELEPDQIQTNESLVQPVENIGSSLSYERDLKNAIVLQIEELFPGYSIFNGLEVGVEYLIEGKRIDILLEGTGGELLIIELKSGVVDFRVFGQISMYIGLLEERFPDRGIKGCIIASEFDRSLIAAIRTNSAVSLKRYNMKIFLEPIEPTSKK
jgi:hypothetical protein